MVQEKLFDSLSLKWFVTPYLENIEVYLYKIEFLNAMGITDPWSKRLSMVSL